ncbi:MetQ/NlpA family ABC transporter substrate-binding protein [Pseudothauera rhizosphaerae]|uniref:MetQ/NlpA family ABC transporter substrate-binding protein n=1 Tax=Pseudothauera rhizosphaerae TaxID=2565932 RepID=A0A4S4AYG6_9RHOO|nr:MetQ/NlpA family ABC transporter substrate-binding protein [Pseudothauera rhizosphaerae]THF65167.1 MetQ/NlpA family ABC transporter substrate-binding protein [Pseudothauera rhizosphaerae]
MQRRTALATLAAAASLALVHTPALAGETLKVGVTAGPHAQVLEVVKRVAARDGLEIRIVEFSDYVQPNAALAAGDLDANSYQHQPYLDNTNADRGYDLVSVAKTIIFPIGLYSKKYRKLADLPQGARVAIPNDPTNGGRSLLLLEANGVIKLKAGAGLKASPVDIVDNPRKLRIVELDAAQLPRVLDEVDAATVNTNYAIPAGLVPTRDAIALESPDSPYANVIAVRARDKDKPAVAKLVRAYHTPEVKAFVEREFQNSIVTAW